MYSKTRNSLTALVAASLFLASGWMFGHPVQANPMVGSPVSLQSAAADEAHLTIGQAILHGHHGTRMSLAMPFYSFSLTTSERRAD